MCDEFVEWWKTLDGSQKESLLVGVELLRQLGPSLGRPHVDSLYGSGHSNMKELRVQHKGRPLRVMFAFDPRRIAVLLVGGDKTGDTRFYERMVRLADKIYSVHLATLE